LRDGGGRSFIDAVRLSLYFAVVGTSVRDRMNTQFIANITASASELTNRARVRKTSALTDADAQQRTNSGVTLLLALSGSMLDLLAPAPDDLDVFDGPVSSSTESGRERHTPAS